MADSNAGLIDIHRSSWVDRLLLKGSYLLARPLFDAIRSHARGATADVGGGEFYSIIRDMGVRFDTWTTIDIHTQALDLKRKFPEENFQVIIGDGCDLREVVPDETYDTIISSQVLEHVFRPEDMVNECARVLRPGGKAIFYLPQTSVLHMAPQHYYNFTRYWIERAVSNAGLETLEYSPVGGTWASHASHLVFFFLQVLRNPLFVPRDTKRNAAFYLFLPFMLAYAAVALPLMMLFALGDLKEGANNHLVVAQKPKVDAKSRD